MAKIFTPVSSRHSLYTSLMAFNSRLQGLHQVAKKSMMNGFPLFDKVSVRTALPLMSLSVTDGNCALTVPIAQVSNTNNDRIVFFII